MLTIETDWRLDVKSESQNVEFVAESSHFFSLCFFQFAEFIGPSASAITLLLPANFRIAARSGIHSDHPD